MKKILTGFSITDINEGQLLTYSHSIVNSNGEITARNEQANKIIIDPEIMQKVKDIQEYIKRNFLI